MSIKPPERLFCVCKLCGEDYTNKKSPKASLARHLRFKHREELSDHRKVTTAYIIKVILKGKVPKCKNPECNNYVAVKGFESVGKFCSPTCCSRYEYLTGGRFTSSTAVSERQTKLWSQPSHKSKMLAIHNSAASRAKKSAAAKSLWKKPGIHETRSKQHKAWWSKVRRDKEFMARRSEASSINASTLLATNPRFGYSRRKEGSSYKGIEMRSSWEVAFAKKLDRLGFKWVYEPHCVKIDEGVRYTPDFYLPEVELYIEVKPREFAKTLAKAKLNGLRKETGNSARFIDLEGIRTLSFETLFNLIPENSCVSI